MRHQSSKMSGLATKLTLGAVRAVPRMYDRVSTLFTSALGIVAALAWHAAVQDLLDLTDLPHLSKLYYALAVTGLAGLSAVVLSEGSALLRFLESGVEPAPELARAPVVGGLEVELARRRS